MITDDACVAYMARNNRGSLCRAERVGGIRTWPGIRKQAGSIAGLSGVESIDEERTVESAITEAGGIPERGKSSVGQWKGKQLPTVNRKPKEKTSNDVGGRKRKGWKLLSGNVRSILFLVPFCCEGIRERPSASECVTYLRRSHHTKPTDLIESNKTSPSMPFVPLLLFLFRFPSFSSPLRGSCLPFCSFSCSIRAASATGPVQTVRRTRGSRRKKGRKRPTKKKRVPSTIDFRRCPLVCAEQTLRAVLFFFLNLPRLR